MFVYLKTPDVGTQGQKEGGLLVGGEVRAREGSFLFLFFFLYHIFVVKVQEIAWSASYGENKTQKPKQTKKVNVRKPLSSTGVRTGPWPTHGREIKTSKAKGTLPKPADSMKNTKGKPSFPETT